MKAPEAGERAILMRQINIWIALGILLALLAITHLLRDEREIRLEHLCDENPSVAECRSELSRQAELGPQWTRTT